MKRILLGLLAVAGMVMAVAGITSQDASAATPQQTVACKAGRHVPGIESTFPAAGKLRATNVPSLTNHYAPRCLVAESIVANVQSFWSEHDRAPRSVWARGARWDGGHWRVSYRVATNGDWSWGEFTATKGNQRVTWEGYS